MRIRRSLALMKKAAKGRMFVVLHFEGKRPQPKKEKSGLVTLQSGGDGKLARPALLADQAGVNWP